MMDTCYYTFGQIFPCSSVVEESVAMQETWVWFLGLEDSLEKEMATHSSILASRIPLTEEPGRLQAVGSQGLNITERLSTAQHRMYYQQDWILMWAINFGFINCNKCINYWSWWRLCIYRGWDNMRKSLCLLNFAVNLKLLLKNSLFLNKSR